jgi:hypothetical protein
MKKAAANSLLAIGLFATVLAITGSVQASDPIEILFVGNSFTHGHSAPAQYYNRDKVTDVNGTGFGGVAGLFKQLTLQAGLNYNVTLEVEGGRTLRWHCENKAAIIGRPVWDVVVLQELSTTPLPANRGGNPSQYAQSVAKLQSLIRANNPAASIYLYETWASPASVIKQGYTNSGGLQAMQNDLQAATYDVYHNLGVTGVARVGDAFLKAVDQGLADPDPSNGVEPGKINFWGEDARHAGAYGSYLSAVVIFAKITGVDPRSLDVGEGSAAQGLGLDVSIARELNRIAFEMTTLAEPARQSLPN